MHGGSFEPVVMFFGLTNLPATFQMMMNNIFRDLINKGDVATFINDVLVGTEMEEGYNKLVEEILRRLEEHDLYVKLEKCEWKMREVEFLRVVIGPDGIKMEKEKVKGVLEWLTPKCVKDIQKFLGLVNYYRRFIKDFAEISRPMHRLVCKQERWNWGAEQEEAFRRLKEIFALEPVLAAPDLDKEMRVGADVSDYAMGRVLFMKCKDERWRPVAYISKLLSNIEKNYKIHDKEMLAVIRCLEAWRHFLESAWIKFKVWMDHKNLEYFMSSQKLNRHQAQWALFLSRFDFKLVHVPGTKMGKADRLSRWPDWQEEVGKENKDRMVVKREWLETRAVEEVVIEGVDILDRIRKLKVVDDEIIKIVEEMKRANVKVLRNEEWREEDRLMLKDGKVYVSKNKELRAEVIRLHHDTPVEEHGGQWKTVELVTRNFWWPRVMTEVKRYVEWCDLCQRNKNRTEPLAGKLMPNEAPDKPWVHIMADFIVKLPLSRGYNSILVVCNRLTKMAYFIPTTEKMSAEGLVVLFRDHVWKLHGLPESIIFNRGAQFAAGLMKELNGMLGIETKLLMAFHPQIDGQTEHANQELEQYLRIFVDYHQEQGLDWLGTAKFAYNNKVNSSIKVLPFMANNDQNPRIGFEMRKKRKVLRAEEFAAKIKEIQEEVQVVLRKVQEEMKKQVDWHRGEVEEYKVADMVLLSTRDLKWQIIGRRTDKLTERFVGPYKVKGIISSNAIELELPSSIRIHPIVNVSRIYRYRD